MLPNDKFFSYCYFYIYNPLAWLDLMQYYISAYKTGSYPAIGKDRIFLWGRLYPAGADAPDGVGRPDNWQWVCYYCIIFLAIKILSTSYDFIDGRLRLGHCIAYLACRSYALLWS